MVFNLKDRPLVTLDDFLSTYPETGPGRKIGERSAQTMVDLGVLPLEYTNEKLLDLNILAAWLQFSGFIGPKYKGLISVSDGFKQELETIAANLSLGMNSTEGKYQLEFGDNGCLYSRLFSRLGVRVSKGKINGKIDRKVNYPTHPLDYVMFLQGKKPALIKKDRQIANKILADYCKVLMFSRGSFYSKFSINLPANKDPKRGKENVENLALQIIEIFNSVYPMIGLDESNKYRYHEKRKKLHYARILFNSQNQINAHKHYGLFGMAFNPSYHPFGKKPTARQA